MQAAVGWTPCLVEREPSGLETVLFGQHFLLIFAVGSSLELSIEGRERKGTNEAIEEIWYLHCNILRVLFISMLKGSLVSFIPNVVTDSLS